MKKALAASQQGNINSTRNYQTNPTNKPNQPQTNWHTKPKTKTKTNSNKNNKTKTKPNKKSNKKRETCTMTTQKLTLTTKQKQSKPIKETQQTTNHIM